jgi:hypothetical protein
MRRVGRHARPLQDAALLLDCDLLIVTIDTGLSFYVGVSS